MNVRKIFQYFSITACFLQSITTGLTFVVLLTVATGLLIPPIAGAASKKKSNAVLSVKLRFYGDLTGEYQFNGQLGARLLGQPVGTPSACEVMATFDRVLNHGQKALQIWLSFKCNETGELRPSRIFFSLENSNKNIQSSNTRQIFGLSKTFRSIFIELQDIK